MTSPVYRQLPLTSLQESKTNPRRHFDPKALKELADSVAVHGVVQPIVVRPINGAGSGDEAPAFDQMCQVYGVDVAGIEKAILADLDAKAKASAAKKKAAVKKKAATKKKAAPKKKVQTSAEHRKPAA